MGPWLGSLGLSFAGSGREETWWWGGLSLHFPSQWLTSPSLKARMSRKRGQATEVGELGNGLETRMIDTGAQVHKEEEPWGRVTEVP